MARGAPVEKDPLVTSTLHNSTPRHPLISGVFLAAGVLMGCTTTNPCADGWARDSAGNCVRFEEPVDSSEDSGNPADTEQPNDSDSTTGDPCTPPEEGPEDPLTDLGFYDNLVESNTMIEFIDVAIDSDRQILWGVGQGGLMAFDISDEQAPALESLTPQDGYGRYHHVYPFPSSDSGGGLVYTTHRSHGLTVFDATESSRPQELSRTIEANLEGMVQVGDSLYVAGRNGVLHRFDISNRTAPTRKNSLSGLGIPQNLSGSVDALYVADQEQGLVVVDPSNPEEPRVVERHAIGSVTSVSHNKDWVVAGGSAGISLFSRTDPLALEAETTMDLGTIVSDVVVDGDLVWAVTLERVVAISLTEAHRPMPFASRSTPYWAMTVDAKSGTAWVGDWGALRGYQADKSVSSPDVDVQVSEILVSESGEDLLFSVANRGNEALWIEAYSADDERVTLEIQEMEVPRQGSVPVNLTFSGGELDTRICILTSDPDQPVSEVRVHTGGVTHPDIGKMAPDFTLLDVDGNSYTLSDFRGQPVVLSYFATW